MSRDIATFPLPQHIRFKLKSSGITTAEDIVQFSPSELCNIAQLDCEEVDEIFNLVSPKEAKNCNGNDITSFSASDLLEQENLNPPIPTSSKALNDILGGGIPLKKLTEVCGMPGAGKTQFCIQLCVNVQIPREYGGLNGEAVYIDTEGSFSTERLVEMADATVGTYGKTVKNMEKQNNGISFTREKILLRVHYFRCKNFIQLMSVAQILPDFFKQHPEVHLLIIDSITFHFRYGFEDDYMKRNRLLNRLSQSFVQISQEFPIAVLITNQMTSRFDGNESSPYIPALGKSWGHTCAIRMILTWDEHSRQACLLKSPYQKDATARYEITGSGIRDYSSSTDDSSLPVHQNKRPRIDA